MPPSETTEARILRRLAVICLLFLAACAPNPSGGGAKVQIPDQSSVDAIRNVVAKYVQSVENVDTELARQVWADAEDISFIHPMGHERGWTEIKTNVYEKLMTDLFLTRKLTVLDVAVKIYGDAAVAEFCWNFEATWRKDSSVLRTAGRETQVLRKSARGIWEIVHIHYSGMPASNPGQGL